MQFLPRPYDIDKTTMILIIEHETYRRIKCGTGVKDYRQVVVVTDMVEPQKSVACAVNINTMCTSTRTLTIFLGLPREPQELESSQSSLIKVLPYINLPLYPIMMADWWCKNQTSFLCGISALQLVITVSVKVID